MKKLRFGRTSLAIGAVLVAAAAVTWFSVRRSSVGTQAGSST